MLIRYIFTLFVLISPALPAKAAISNFDCLPAEIGEKVLKLEYRRVQLTEATEETRTYIGDQAGVTYRITLDACSTQVLKTTQIDGLAG